MNLAINGGKPVRETFLSYGQQWLDEDDINSVVDVLKSDFITQGPIVEQFEAAIATYVGAKHAVSFCNGTAALHAACFAAGIQPGDEVITTPITFAASANCVLYLGGRPVFADIDERTYNIDPGQIEQHITPNTKAIIPVDFTGQPAEMDRIRKIAERHGLVIIQDAAHSLGAAFKGQKVGTLADMTMFSFHPVKPITTGEGGIIVTDSDTYADKLRLFRNHGIRKHPDDLTKHHGPWYYEMHELGLNYRLTDIQAALGRSQLAKLESFLSRRRELAAKYTEALQKISGITVPYQHPLVNSGWHLYVVKWEQEAFTAGRKKIFEALRAENIGVHVHYIPVYYHPYYCRLGYSKGLCPVAEAWYEQAMTLPLFPKMADSDLNHVVEAVQKVAAALSE